MSEVTPFVKTPDKGWLNSYIYLPITMKQFETLTNDILVHMNRMAENTDVGFGPEYMAHVLTSVIHALDRKEGQVRREQVFYPCLNIISRHVSYHITQEHQKKLKAQEGTDTVPLSPEAGQAPEALGDEVRGQTPDAPQTVI